MCCLLWQLYYMSCERMYDTLPRCVQLDTATAKSHLPVRCAFCATQSSHTTYTCLTIEDRSEYEWVTKSLEQNPTLLSALHQMATSSPSAPLDTSPGFACHVVPVQCVSPKRFVYIVICCLLLLRLCPRPSTSTNIYHHPTTSNIQ